MAEYCEKCGRPVAARAYGGGNGPEPGTTCSQKGSTNCVTAALAFRRGMREGVGLVRSLVISRERAAERNVGYSEFQRVETSGTLWDEVASELARRCGDG